MSIDNRSFPQGTFPDSGFPDGSFPQGTGESQPVTGTGSATIFLMGSSVGVHVPPVQVDDGGGSWWFDWWDEISGNKARRLKKKLQDEERQRQEAVRAQESEGPVLDLEAVLHTPPIIPIRVSSKPATKVRLPERTPDIITTSPVVPDPVVGSGWAVFGLSAVGVGVRGCAGQAEASLCVGARGQGLWSPPSARFRELAAVWAPRAGVGRVTIQLGATGKGRWDACTEQELVTLAIAARKLRRAA